MDRKTRNDLSKKKERDSVKVMDYHKYETDPIHFQTWVDMLYSKINVSIPAASALIGAVVFLAGVFIASMFNFGEEYLRTKAIYIGVFGIALVSGMVRYASLNIHRVYEELRPCFLVSDETYRKLISRWFSKLSNNTGNTVSIAIYGILAILLAYGEFSSPLVNRQSVGSIKAYFFEPFWYSAENLWGKIAIIAAYGICVALPLGIATSLLANNRSFMKDLTRLSVIPAPHIIRMRMREVVEFYLAIIFTWSIGIGLFGLVFFNDLDAASFVFLSIMNFFGLTTFISPQILYRNYLRQANTTISRQALKQFHARVNIHLTERPADPLKDAILDRAGGPIPFSPASRLVYEWTDFVVLAAAQIIVYGTVFLSKFL